ncbi:MAG: imidazole glycerol phosphate synthase subunit HisF [Candidatus Izemoplasmataceae bacterium]
MLTKRIIPCLDVRNNRVVKGVQFANLIDISSPKELGQFYSEQGADELVFYDVTASSEKRGPTLTFIKEVAQSVNIPFSVGGGVNTLDDVKQILLNGADKVSINSGAVKQPDLLTKAAKKFGSQCVVLSIDAKRNYDHYDVYINGGKTKTNLEAIAWAKKGVALGAGEIVINSIDNDGMRGGFDLELLTRITNTVDVPVIASGGVGNINHFLEVFKETNVDAALAASVFHLKELSINQVKQSLKANNIPIRLEETL